MELLKIIKCSAICVYTYIKLEVTNFNKINMSLLCLINSIQGKFSVEIKKGDHCSIGKFIMVRGLMYNHFSENYDLKVVSQCFLITIAILLVLTATASKTIVSLQITLFLWIMIIKSETMVQKNTLHAPRFISIP